MEEKIFRKLKKLLCKNSLCIHCELSGYNNEKDLSCWNFCNEYREEAEKICLNWYKELELTDILMLDEKNAFCAIFETCVDCPMSNRNNVQTKSCSDFFETSFEEAKTIILDWYKDNLLGYQLRDIDNRNTKRVFSNKDLKAVAETRADILEKAKEVVTKERLDYYGNPENAFSKVADYWTDYVRDKECLSEIDVCMMMTLLKIARAEENPMHKDNYIDIAGYAACAGSFMED